VMGENWGKKDTAWVPRSLQRLSSAYLWSRCRGGKANSTGLGKKTQHPPVVKKDSGISPKGGGGERVGAKVDAGEADEEYKRRGGRGRPHGRAVTLPCLEELRGFDPGEERVAERR